MFDLSSASRQLTLANVYVTTNSNHSGFSAAKVSSLHANRKCRELKRLARRATPISERYEHEKKRHRRAKTRSHSGVTCIVESIGSVIEAGKKSHQRPSLHGFSLTGSCVINANVSYVMCVSTGNQTKTATPLWKC